MRRHQSATSRAERDAAFRQAVEDAKNNHNITDVVRLDRKVTRIGREWKALCAFHNERSPSMQLNDAKGTFYCFGCGRAGDLVTFVMETRSLGFMDALRWLGAADLPAVNPADRARAAEEDMAARAAAIADAQMMWDRCVDPNGTPADTYLREVRGITMPLPPAVRFGVVPASRDEEGRWKRPWPAVVFSVLNGMGEVVGLQRIFIADDGRSKRWGKQSKLSLGRPRGSCVRLTAGISGEVVICEGPEDGLSLAQEMPDRTVWVALGTSMMPEIQYPPSLRSLTIAGQNDEPGRRAVEKARAALVEKGIAVRLIYPDARFKDWNDELRGIIA